jgi:hypothetical protein
MLIVKLFIFDDKIVVNDHENMNFNPKIQEFIIMRKIMYLPQVIYVSMFYLFE